MGKKKIKSDGIYFTGESANDVTGSQYVVKFGNYQCLLECGLHQSKSNDYLDSYRINSEKFKFKPEEIDFLFVAHPHIDHCGLIPRLVKEKHLILSHHLSYLYINSVDNQVLSFSLYYHCQLV